MRSPKCSWAWAPDAERELFARRFREIEPEQTPDPLFLLTLGVNDDVEPSWGLRQTMWRSDVGGFRRSKHFHDLIEEVGIGDYWRAHVPVGEGVWLRCGYRRGDWRPAMASP